MSETVASEPRRRHRRGGLFGFLRDLIIILVVAFLVSFLLKTFLVRSFYIPSPSMEQTLMVNDRILVNQLVPDVVGVQRGDIVVFKDPGGWLHPSGNLPPQGFEKVLQAVGLAADTSDEYVVKRVIGIGGDRVSCCDAQGRVMVNGVPIDEPYAVIPQGEKRASAIDFDVTVPEGSVWVMGDNRYASKDSRYNQDQPGKGFVPEDEIVGRAFVLNWPLNRFSWLGTPEGTFTGVEEAKTSK
ncbi:signal peptidase I [Leucobacter insecticola]|uniref:Signal peptidase I n=1 Tax=Leucobacter insecticola TaxID=2714934 RepID=A0A6G8FK65_9MICO|nr:signal peptidase I [Leucobacter insecticola]QIM16738.1 signal peptidase I [Leucobacter insecticola]